MEAENFYKEFHHRATLIGYRIQSDIDENVEPSPDDLALHSAMDKVFKSMTGLYLVQANKLYGVS